jgi:hypothetical protein
LCRPSVRPSARLSFSYFSAAIAPRELKFSKKSVALQWSIVRSGIRGPWPRGPEIWPWSGPLPKKYTFTSVTRVRVVQIEQMRAHLKGLSARIVMSSESMVTCASGLLPYPAKVPYFQYRVWWYSIVLKFHNDGKKFKNHIFRLCALHRPMSMIWLKSQKCKIGYDGDGILSIGNFILMIKKFIFYFFSCPVTDQQPKNLLPISVVTRNFLFIWN